MQEAVIYQLPAPDFRVGHRRTIVTIYGPRAFGGMSREDRIRACYQHCALKWVVSERMTNQSLRGRFHLQESKTAIISQVIAATIDAGMIQAGGGGRKLTEVRALRAVLGMDSFKRLPAS